MSDDAMPAEGSTPPPLIAAIGDVHGMADLLATVLSGLDDLASKAGRPLKVYFLGDIVDRGSASRQALDRVAETLKAWPDSRLCLGNHDEWFLRFLQNDLDPDELDNWLDQGGAETLLSYGIGTDATAERARQEVLSNAPVHLPLLRNASIMEIDGSFAFVHAGIDPTRPIDAQDRHDCVWIRAPFLNHVGALSHVVVHGHQPQKGGVPVVTENRISMDTGAVFTGHLSAVLIDPAGGLPQFFQADSRGGFASIEARRLDRGLGTVLDPSPNRSRDG